MRLPIITIILILCVSLLVDWYIYTILKKRTKNKKCQRVHLCVSLALLIYIIVGVSIPRRSGSDDVFMSIMWILYSYATILIPQIIFVLIDLLSSIPLLFKGKRIKSVTFIGLGVAVLTFFAMWWGALFNRYNINVVAQDVFIENLPETFDGYRIAQISDLHVGTFDRDTTFVSNAVEAINKQDVDMVVFTGDIVNRRATELEAFVKTLSSLQSQDGVYSVLGNHDYGDYVNWTDDEEKIADFNKLRSLQKSMNWKLLMNETQFIYRGNDSIALIGVENWGDPPFPVYGDLKQSYKNLSDSTIKVLLTHNPAHWVAEIADNDSCNIALTLSGHTHAMQISIGSISPASWRYKTWGGKYEDNSKKHILYVNIGLGTVGIPTRIGANPEITILTLRRK